MPSPVLADPLDGHDHAAVVELDRQATCRLLPETRCRAAGEDASVGLWSGRNLRQGNSGQGNAAAAGPRRGAVRGQRCGHRPGRVATPPGVAAAQVQPDPAAPGRRRPCCRARCRGVAPWRPFGCGLVTAVDTPSPDRPVGCPAKQRAPKAIARSSPPAIETRPTQASLPEKLLKPLGRVSALWAVQQGMRPLACHAVSASLTTPGQRREPSPTASSK